MAWSLTGRVPETQMYPEPWQASSSALAVAVLGHATMGSGSAEGGGWYRLPVGVSDTFGEYSLPGPNDPL
jgi:hypothetical protein